MAAASVEVGEKSVRYLGKDYATLDFTPPRTAAKGNQTDFLAVPEGWALAEPSEDVVKEVVAKFPWGTNGLVFGNGAAYWTSTLTPPGMQAMQFPGNYLQQRRGKYKTTNLTCGRVLICAEAANGDRCTQATAESADGDHCAQAMTRLWETREFPDCEVVCNGHVFQCHRGVLAQASPVFKQMLSGEMLEAKTQRIQLEALETETEAASAFLAFVYTGKLDCKSEHFPTVVKLADFYQLDCITTKTCNGMLQALDASNVVPIARLFKSVRKKPRTEPYWTKLVDKVHKSRELAAALLSDA